ncbi:MAG: CHASE2 domain-containing protein [Candidatus Eisenbacteria bacterium]|nr:CHASE2 domain-containing protein [Candidatus Eisenbacteria bacterium]
MKKKTAEKRVRFLSVTNLLICVASTFLALFLSHIDFFDNLELFFLNKRFEIRGAEDAGNEIIIIAVDDTSIEDLPYSYPWPRSLYGRAVTNLKAAGAKLVVFDVEFTEASSEAEDLLFAKALREAGNVILAGRSIDIRGKVKGVGLLPPIEPLRQSAKSWGLVDSYTDSDGFLRRYAFSRTITGKIYHSLGVEALRQLYGIPDSLTANTHSKLRIGRTTIPAYGDNFFLINYAGPPHSFKYQSLSSVLDDSTFTLTGDGDMDSFEVLKEAGVFRDKIVLIGVSLLEAHDLVLTPFYKGRGGSKSYMPGVEMHANALRTVLDGKFIRAPGGGKGLAYVPLYLAISLLTIFLTRRTKKPTLGLLVLVVLSMGVGVSAIVLFSKKLIWVNVMAPEITIFAANCSTIIEMFVEEQKDKRFIKSAFQHYLPKTVMTELFKNPELLALGGEEREISILFTDIAGFTTISESLGPSELSARLNEYLSRMTDVIFEFDGTLDKYQGDAIMAEFGAPIPTDKHPLNACRCALKMKSALREMCREWENAGKIPFRNRTGINSGRAVVGNMGSSVLFDYTAIGDSVNLASRLEGANKEYGTDLLISEMTYLRVKDEVDVRELDEVRVKGKKLPIKIYELLGMKGEPLEDGFRAALELYEKGLALYHLRKWSEAVSFFEQVLKIRPADGPSKTYLARCLSFAKNPPPDNWDGIFEFEVK